MKNFLIWLYWKLFVSIDVFTCYFVTRNCGYKEGKAYKNLLLKNNCEETGLIKVRGLCYSHPQTYKQMRRDFMWRFLVKGER